MFLHTPKAVPSVLSSHTRSLGRTFNRQDEPASAAEGCLSDRKKCPQGLKPVLHRIVHVRAEARTLQRVGSHADSLAPEVRLCSRLRRTQLGREMTSPHVSRKAYLSG